MRINQEYFAGVTWGAMGRRGTWATSRAERSMELMAALTGANWTAIAFAALQAKPQSTVIPFRDEPTITDDELRWAIAKARSLNLKVCLKPIVNCADGTWRAHINFFDKDVPCEPKWSEWFSSYTAYILHYAAIAEETGCDLLCIGCETVQADRRESEWRSLIAEVRKVYSGPITYNCDKYQEDNVTWWDAVDLISSSGYYPEHDWAKQLDRIERVAKSFGKPFFFMEAGCPSRKGSAAIPNDWNLQGEPDELEQARYYRAMFAACEERPWVQGFMLWDWPARLYEQEEAGSNDDYCMYGKTSESIVRDYYTSKVVKSSI
ncbi:1,4-beta-xylanase [Paenibacillus sp. HN-1]|uniref:glycoside hydrolase family 113 n=1 Tax=Paenibacillus TaxID=44249 RepID=UPI001CA86F24|nr:MULTISPECIES: 1,4-beta-xylanase [Paenibacillus]MBY9080560.1 1,4-beta-xylanase [Paenibacillus sp. CGMCC 1.18879]MBY9085495.1 1,4-beta-xylanase [Paenibacillus sinensis]